MLSIDYLFDLGQCYRLVILLFWGHVIDWILHALNVETVTYFVELGKTYYRTATESYFLCKTNARVFQGAKFLKPVPKLPLKNIPLIIYHFLHFLISSSNFFSLKKVSRIRIQSELRGKIDMTKLESKWFFLEEKWKYFFCLSHFSGSEW